jgi:uncharacterized protein (DUF433 family)
MRPTFSPTEAAVLAETPLRRVHKELEHRIIAAATPPRLEFGALVYLRALRAIGLDLNVADRARLYRAVLTAVRSASESIDLAEHLVFHVGPLIDEMRDRVDRFERWKAALVTTGEVMGGEPVFPGSRLTVRHIGEVLERGEAPAVVLEDHPELTAHDLEMARLFVRAYPRVGRPSVRDQAARR